MDTATASTNTTAARPADACAVPLPRFAPADIGPDVHPGVRPLMEQFGYAPGLIEGWLGWYQPLVLGGRVPTRTKELVRLAIASRTGCHMCQNSRNADPSGVGPAVDPETAAAVMADDWSRCTDQERAALTYAVAFWDDHREVSDEVVNAACAAYGRDGFLEIAVAAAQFSGMGRMFQMLGIAAGQPVA